jgi:phosphohistidine phosphatase
MRTIAILRHAKSSWGDAAARDFDRRLDDRGRLAAERIGRELKQRGVRFDHVLASPATRVRETLERLSHGYGALPEIRFDDSLYGASERHLLTVIRALPGEVRFPLIVGHNPGLHSLVLTLTSDDDQGLRRRIAPKFPTAAFAAIDVPVEDWNEVEPGAGRLRELILPRELD